MIEIMRATSPHFKSAGRLRFFSGSDAGWIGSGVKSTSSGDLG